MTLDELYTRWIIGPCQVDCVIINTPSRLLFKRDGFAHSAMLGDFLQAYMEHLSIPWYRKKWDWAIVKNEMIRCLNCSIRINFSSVR